MVARLRAAGKDAAALMSPARPDAAFPASYAIAFDAMSLRK
jgi:hypothetical protein